MTGLEEISVPGDKEKIKSRVCPCSCVGWWTCSSDINWRRFKESR